MGQVSFIEYDESGEPVFDGRCPDYDFVLQGREEGRTAMIVPDEARVITDIQIEPIKAMLAAQVDAAAAAVILPGMQPIYARKLAEAQAGGGPLLEAEAQAFGITVADLIQQVLARAAEQSALEVRVELARRQAKAAITAAPNVGKAHQASLVDWAMVAAGAEPQPPADVEILPQEGVILP